MRQVIDFNENEVELRDKLVGLLKSRDITPTAQRIEVGAVLFAAPQHLSAEQILDKVRAKGLRISKATIYNTLNLFATEGLVREVNVDPSRTFYDSTIHGHHHFYNSDTGELIDIPEDGITFVRLPDLPEGTVADEVEVVIRLKNKA